jgi:hypothetical protein
MMALVIGNVSAESGMSQAIYVEIDALLSPPLQEAVDNASDDAKPAAQEALDKAREGWQKLAFAVATGVINHIVNELEVHNVQTRGTVNTTVNGNTGPAAPANHQHTVSVSGTAANVLFRQNNNGRGLVR